jgi:hypothetical protein
MKYIILQNIREETDTDTVYATQLTRLCTAKMAVTTATVLVYCVIHTHNVYKT